MNDVTRSAMYRPLREFDPPVVTAATRARVHVNSRECARDRVRSFPRAQQRWLIVVDCCDDCRLLAFGIANRVRNVVDTRYSRFGLHFLHLKLNAYLCKEERDGGGIATKCADIFYFMNSLVYYGSQMETKIYFYRRTL